MTKKQFSIIFTLMALIVCVGVLAAKLNKEGFTDPTDLGQAILNQDVIGEDDETETLGSQDYFYALRSEKEQNDAITIQQLKEMSEDEQVSQEQKDLAKSELLTKTTLVDQEGRIEVGVKNKGFEDVLCSIEKNTVRVVVKADELTDADTTSIQEIAENISGISDIIIEPKK